MLCVDDGDEGELQQTKAIHPWKSIVHNIGARLCGTNCTPADTQRQSNRDREREKDRE